MGEKVSRAVNTLSSSTTGTKELGVVSEFIWTACSLQLALPVTELGGANPNGTDLRLKVNKIRVCPKESDYKTS